MFEIFSRVVFERRNLCEFSPDLDSWSWTVISILVKAVTMRT